MRRPLLVVLLSLACWPAAGAVDDWLDRLDESLTFSAFDQARVHFSGLLDLEGYSFSTPAPALIETNRDRLFNPRLTLFTDVQWGDHVYAFAQTRLDRGFDPSGSDARLRADEYALRVSPWSDGRVRLQIGKFATVVGSWVNRHDSWTNPFVTAPLLYENLTPVWDSDAPDSPQTLRGWGHLTAASGYTAAAISSDKYLRNPIIWGPSYATGVSLSGRLGKWDYAAEMKNVSLASRPENWDLNGEGFQYPTFSGRVGFRPDPRWNLGVSASAGPYLLPEAYPTIPASRSIGDYREFLLGQDIGFAWRHLQLWAEVFETRFQVPNVGNADVLAYYLEARYQLAPQLYGALRWNQELYGRINDGLGGSAPWGRDICRADLALGYRLSPRMQVKLQLSLQHEEHALQDVGYTLAGQFTIRY